MKSTMERNEAIPYAYHPIHVVSRQWFRKVGLDLDDPLPYRDLSENIPTFLDIPAKFVNDQNSSTIG